MGWINYAITPIKRRLTRRKKMGGASLDHAARDKAVLAFLSFGLTYGIEALRQYYRPNSKVQEFVAVTEEIVSALKEEANQHFANGCVTLFMKVNYQPRHIEVAQVGNDVMLSLDKCATFISHITLEQLYANIRHDITQHSDVYGEDLARFVASLP